ncbi:MAG TPA: GH92 family glycosyl hydrolase [Acidimicrobiales bacterium]|nr:GH92 family glycosyl hydrolase [Acidimicrobiales bacterium]
MNRRPLVVLVVIAAVLVGLLPAVDAGAASAVSVGPAPLISDPVGLVNPLAGTGAAPVAPGNIGEFPGADVPFGMVQWSPDTTPDRTDGSGYSYADSDISGFSLTHMSGTGCASYGDVPVLPTVGPIGVDPENANDSFSHSGEEASPGRYRVALGPAKITAELTVTTRTGLSQFTFPRTGLANVLFKVSDSANGVSQSGFHAVGDDEISGQVTSGQFCDTGTPYTLYFTARFNRPFASVGSWDGSLVSPGSRSCAGKACGAFVSFDAAADRSVLMKVGVSFVSTGDATRNLGSEDPGWSLGRIESLARQRWNSLLGRVRIGGGARSAQRTFYTALYHSLLHPNVVSDDNGQYIGSDGRVHRSRTHAQYANFSEWDIYRSEIQLVSLVAPHQAGDMIQSLVNDAEQGGWLPKWAIVGGDASQMNGDSADPIIADAYAFGVRGFDVEAALRAMVKGATQSEPIHGLEIEREFLDQYLAQHYVDAGSLDLDSIDYSIGGSVTLEYAIDDFSIAQLASALGDRSLALAMMQRGHNWEYLFNPVTGYIEARNADGSFPEGPAFQTSMFEDGGQVGFEEGNAIQYTWAVPQDLAALGSLMGGNAAAVAKLNTFFTQLNAGRYLPYDWAGNEPSLWTPWEYDYFGAPSRTQEVVRRIATTLYSDHPDDEPGNDDLGAMSSWYVWAAIGLFPVTPGAADLALASPLFPDTVLTLPDNRTLVLHAPRASASTPYIHSLTVGGAKLSAPAPPCASVPPASGAGGWNRPWLPSSIITTGGTVTFGLSATPDASWGASPAASPPSFATGRLPAVGFSVPAGGMSLRVGQPATLQVGVEEIAPGGTAVRWSVAAGGLTLSADSGVLSPPRTTGCTGPGDATQSVTVEASVAGSFRVVVRMQTAAGMSLAPVVLDLVASS